MKKDTTFFWHSDKRYYKATLCMNLFDEYCIEKEWGGKYTKHKGRRIDNFNSVVEATKELQRIHKLRIRHNYIFEV